SKNISILDPGCGTAILTCALIENLISNQIESIDLIAYETDYELLPYTEQSLQYLKKWLKNKNIIFKYTLFTSDFIEDIANTLDKEIESFDYIISNPPYFKLSKDDKRVKLLDHLVKGQPNIYSLFMAVSVNLLKKNGELIFIVPRSFASGQYFNSFRDYLFSNVNLNFVHLFKSRSETFDRDKVLQETLILKCSKDENKKVIISTSEGIKDLNSSKVKTYDLIDIIDLNSNAKILHLPTTNYEEKVIELFKSWNNNLKNFGIQISTGPVVSFRIKEHLFEIYQNSTVFLAPLFWLNNVTKMNIEWPKFIANKSQYINIIDKTKSVLLPNKNYVFLRRFSSKDDKSRLIASPYFSKFSKTKYIGVENKLNYIYKIDGELEINEAYGIAALLNSKIYDTYFRTFNGNVNVSATEIRLMTFPDIETVREIGNYINSQNDFSEELINEYINNLFLNNFELVNG
ncbi:MAG: hypothetical protein A3G95_09145, partial [Flavobacteria bacterium RIFCSPLOWO2_12_FULL_31_7]